MKRAVFVVLVACGGQTSANDSGTMIDGGIETSTIDVMVKESGVDAADASVPIKEFCPGDAQFDITISGEAQMMWEGRRVVLSAVENDSMSQKQIRRVIVAGVIKNSKLSLTCMSSLHETYAYPSWAVYADADGDGHCSSGDFAVSSQLFGWNADVVGQVTSSSWQSVTTMQPPIGNANMGFCAGYFE